HLDNAALRARVLSQLERELAGLEVRASMEVKGRRRIAVDGRRVVGFSMRLTGLDATSSLKVQRAGLGGKRRMGCGVFVPTLTR
ncbi:type I-MYXAN CRISPR-associated protein Cas6/Cmx6, partial [Escherichia coli]|uniref:type I-MYXAN CRISPR-associated protein Cas6/Cmx6 n=1 Tax=Escherichia coli TaxID=562 RepID=UPI00183984A1